MSQFTLPTTRLARLLACALLISCQAGHAQQLRISEALQMARAGDPSWQAAQAAQSAMDERLKQAKAALLPQANISANANDNRRKYITRNSPFPAAYDNYESNSVQLNINQPVWRTANRAAVTQAKATFNQAQYQTLAAEQDLLVRLAQAWFDWMLARDGQLAAQAQLQLSEFQMAQAERGEKTGLTSNLQTEEARMHLRQAEADWSAAQADYEVRLAALEQVTGPLPANLQPPMLADEYKAPELKQAQMREWLDIANQSSPQAQAARQGVLAALEEVRKQRAGHEPTLDFVATLSRTQQEAGGFPGQNGSDVRQRSFGFQLNIPLFAAGSVNSRVREALAARSKAESELEAAQRQARLNTRQAWNQWNASNARENAAQQGVRYWTEMLKAANTGQATGLKSGQDVLQAQQQLYNSLRELQKARYDQVTSYLKLKALAGLLQDSDLHALERWLIPGRNTLAAGVR
ncbi:TolC family outer membrane protein [Massilia sp. W12]|uniref:TolC family outer membrane protein n=1 Tax=Massilia sp. W12 TaxID=3126507 RepID=UPI0030D3A1B4